MHRGRACHTDMRIRINTKCGFIRKLHMVGAILCLTKIPNGHLMHDALPHLAIFGKLFERVNEFGAPAVSKWAQVSCDRTARSPMRRHCTGFCTDCVHLGRTGGYWPLSRGFAAEERFPKLAG